MKTMLCTLTGLVLVFAAGCQTPTGADRYDRSRPTVHTLTWTEYDGSPAARSDNVRYVLDGRAMGRGQGGWNAVCLEIALLPTNSEVVVQPSFGKDVDQPEYPFDVRKLKAHGDKYGVAITVPPPPARTQPAR